MTTIDVPYLVVGGGPIGLLAGILLAEQGREALVIERRDGPQTAPAAHVVNARTLEIFRQAGLDMEAILAAAKDPADAGHVNFVTRLGGDLVGRLPFERQGDECLRYTPTPLRNLSQHRLEPLLVGELHRRDGVELRYGFRWEASVQDDQGVTSHVTDATSGEVVEIRSRWVIACDGAGSRVRKASGIEMEGPQRIQSFVMVHFEAALREILGDHVGVLHFVMDPEAGGTFVAHDLDREWVYMHAFDPETESLEDFDDERCQRLVRRAIAVDAGPIEILHRGTWHMSAQVATAMRHGRIFLAGDAAHRFPPTGGLGLNTGAADIHALVWRLGAVDDGWGTDVLLETYATERLPIAHTNAQASLENALKMVLLGQALGVDDDPSTAQLERALADPGRRGAIDAAVDAQATHFDMLGLQLGYVYERGALASAGGSRTEEDPVRQYEPSGTVGARLPHAWLADGVGSTLDLIDAGCPTLVSWGAHERWADAAAATEAPVRHIGVGEGVSVDDAWRLACGVGADGAVLVRPDQHVAWRSCGCPGDPVGALQAAVSAVSGG